MGLNGLQFSSVLPSMKIKFKSIINMAQSFRLENLTSTKFYSVLLWHILYIQMPLYDKMDNCGIIYLKVSGILPTEILQVP